MSTVRVGAIRFKIYPNDHEPRHVHAFIGAGEVIVDLQLDGTVVLARRKRGAIRGVVTRSEVRIVLIKASDAFGDLVRFWEAMHDENE